MMDCRAVFFDVGDTLIFNNRDFKASLRLLLRRVGIVLEAAEVKRLVESSDRAFRERMKAARGREEYRQARVDYYRHLLSLIGVNDSDLPFFFQENIRYYHEAYLKPDALYTLSALKAAGLPVGIVSNFSHALPGMLAHLGVLEYVNFVTYSDDVGVEKPEPAIFRDAIEKLNAHIPPERIVHVGDSYEADVLGARACGITPVLIAHAKPDSCDCACIACLSELLDLIGVDHPMVRRHGL